jgi:hypothetical protein
MKRTIAKSGARTLQKSLRTPKLAKQSRLQAKLTALDKLVKSDKSLRIAIPIGVVLIFVVSLFFLNGGSWPKLPGSGPTAEEYKDQLQSQVDTEDGAPRSGRDPSTQQQTSLEDAASKPTGAGTRTDTPASGVTGDHDTHHTAEDVYGSNSDAQKSGISAAGCYIDYGIQGEQCLPAHAAGSDGKLDCSEVRKHFPNGVKVTGTDRFKLDKNGDKLACGQGE